MRNRIRHTTAEYARNTFFQLPVFLFTDERLHESHVISLQLSERGKQLLQAAIDESEAESTHTDTPEPPQTVPEQPVKQKWYQRLIPRRKST